MKCDKHDLEVIEYCPFCVIESNSVEKLSDSYSIKSSFTPAAINYLTYLNRNTLCNQ